MTTTKINTRFMWANKDVENVIFDIMVEKYGIGVIASCDVDFEEALYSSGFICAIENGLTPVLESFTESFERKTEGEYHHMIINNECYVMYFE